MIYKLVTKNVEETGALARKIANASFSGMVICLDGDLGSGKTTFTKFFAQELGIKEEITSPTFTIVKEYNSGVFPLFHMDAYRLENTEIDIGISEYFNRSGISIIEWSAIINGELPDEKLEIEINIISEETREFILKPHGKRYKKIIEVIQ